MKQKHIIVSIIAVLLLIGLVLVWTLGKGTEKENEDNAGKDITIHQSDKNTVEEKAEGGLQESDSEDGPILDEDTMIDFNGGDAQTGGEGVGEGDDTTEVADEEPTGGDTTEDTTGNEEDDEDTEDTEDTGTWGGFY